MTTKYAISIHCDRCGEWVEAAPALKPAGIAGTLVMHLKRQGWSRVNNSYHTDLCPTCVESDRKAEPK